MRYRFTYTGGPTPVDLEVSADVVTSVADLAKALVARDPRVSTALPDPTLRITDPGGTTTLPAQQPLIDSALRSGCEVSVVDATPDLDDADQRVPVALLTVIEGPQAGRSHYLFEGVNSIGRDAANDVRLRDESILPAHAQIEVTTTETGFQRFDIDGLGAKDRIVVLGIPVPEARLEPDAVINLGETRISVRPIGTHATLNIDETFASSFLRRPRLAPTFAPETHPTPDIPQRPPPTRFPLVALIMPVLMGGVLFAITGSATSLLFVALSPLMMIGNWIENRTFGRRQYRTQVEAFTTELDALKAFVEARQREELEVRNAEDPPTDTVVRAIDGRTDLLWCKRPQDDGFVRLRLGTGQLASRVTLDLPSGSVADTECWSQLSALASEQARVDGVPVLADLKVCGSLGIAGPGDRGAGIARAVVMQAAGLHSPGEVCIAAAMGPVSSARWQWLKWLPHTMPTYSPIDCELLADSTASAARLVSSVEDLLDLRAASATVGEQDRRTMLLLVTNDTDVDRARLVGLAERGSAHGIHVVWCAGDLAQLPAACRVYVSIDNRSEAVAGFLDEGLKLTIEPDTLDQDQAQVAARALAPVVDAGARVDDDTDLPGSIPFLALAGTDLADDAAAVVSRWHATDTLRAHRDPSRPHTRSTLRSVIGQGASGPFSLDLKTDGPHALVGGTTGAGKSELLQTWILSMAAEYSPERVTFLLVDYKGASAFGPCEHLPHTVGLITDLSPHLVRRALISLNAELIYREHRLSEAKAKDLETLERQGNPNTPPSLVIVVDEFAALKADVPEFVEGVVNVAQRGRSLGLHLILATQRPAGAIGENLRANTNLRLALRVADAEDSTNVLGSPEAAQFDPGAPGRAAARIGSSRLVPFQAGYLGGVTRAQTAVAEINITEVAMGLGAAWPPPSAPAEAVASQAEASDLDRLVGTITAAAAAASVEPPRRPWLDALPPVIDLLTLPRDAATPGQFIFGLGDRPKTQQQLPVSFDADVDGGMVVYGTGGTGKSGVLRSIAAAAALGDGQGPVHVYGLDFGSQGLYMLEGLRHVGAVIAEDDTERVLRLLRTTRRLMDERAPRYAVAKASTITEYRRNAEAPDEPRILILLDGLANFLRSYDTGTADGPLQTLSAIASGGRGVGIHVILTADRPGTMPSALGSLFPRRLVLRLADDNDYSFMAVPPDVFTLQSPPGSGYLDKGEVQVAVPGGSTSVADQERALADLTARQAEELHWRQPAPVQRLADDIAFDSLPLTPNGPAFIGIGDSDLQPIGIPTRGTFLVAGPTLSGRTTAVRTIVSSMRQVRPGITTVLFTQNETELAQSPGWTDRAVGIDAAARGAAAITRALATSAAESWVIVLENPAGFEGTAADAPLQELVNLARARDQLVVAEGDTQTLTGSFPALRAAVRFSRCGIVLKPDRGDGEALFRFMFPPLNSADFPVGRGMLVLRDRAVRVQVARV